MSEGADPLFVLLGKAYIANSCVAARAVDLSHEVERLRGELRALLPLIDRARRTMPLDDRPEYARAAERLATLIGRPPA